jgi:hypothetical protein
VYPRQASDATWVALPKAENADEYTSRPERPPIRIGSHYCDIAHRSTAETGGMHTSRGGRSDVLHIPTRTICYNSKLRSDVSLCGFVNPEAAVFASLGDAEIQWIN